MNKVILFFIVIIYSQQLFGQEKISSLVPIVQGSNNLPLELNLMLDSLQNTSDDNQILRLSDSSLNSIKYIDAYAGILTKDDVFLIGKIEIYKTLLKINKSSPQAVINENSLNILRKSIQRSTDPFITWFLQALLHDCETLLAELNSKDYLAQKKANTLDQLKLKKMNKKIQILYRWVSQLRPDAIDFQETFKMILAPFLNASLKNIEDSFFLMVSQSVAGAIPLAHTSIITSEISSEKKLKFFSIKEIAKKIAKPEKKEKSVEDILASMNDLTANKDKKTNISLPKPSNENWIENENTPENLKNLPRPSDDADWLQDF